MCVHELLSSFCLRSSLIVAFATLVQGNLQFHNTTKDNYFQVRINSRDEHRLCQLWSNIFIPSVIEIWILASHRSNVEWEWSILEICIGHEYNDTCVDECCPEDGPHDQTYLLRLC
jgi:hypothetical protein